jgi:hypothetical protein
MRTKRQRDAIGQRLLFDAECVCRGCRRWLRSNRSVRRGYGPTCWRRKRDAEKRRNGEGQT